MGPKSGTRGFLQLGSNFEEPRWRQAVIVKAEEGRVKTLVRSTLEEIDKSQLSYVTVGSYHYCMVESSIQQLRMGAPSGALPLDGDQKELVAAGKKALETEDELNFATASEPGAKPHKSKAAEEESSSSSAEEEGEGSELLREFRKNWLDSGTRGDKKANSEEEASAGRRHRSKRFSLLEKNKHSMKKGSSSLEDKKAEAVLQAALNTSDPLQGLLALQIAQSMKSKKEKKNRRRSPSTSSARTLSSSESTSSSEARRNKGHSKAVAGYRRAGKRKFKQPLKHVRGYVKHIEEELGAQDKPFRLVDFNRRIHFGKQQNLKRCHYLVCIILEWLLKEEPEKAALQATLALQAMRQVAIDGTWDIGWLLTHVAEDPFKTRLFGGDPDSLQHVTAYLKSMNELAKSTQSLRSKGSGKTDQEGDHSAAASSSQQKGKGKNHARAKDKEKDKDKSNTES